MTRAPWPLEADRLRRVRDVGTYSPRTPADASAMTVYALCGWVKETAPNRWELTDEGKKQIGGNDHG